MATVLRHAAALPVFLFLMVWTGARFPRVSRRDAVLATVCLPVSALLLSALVLGEPIYVWQWLGLACVLLAMLLAVPGKVKVARPQAALP